MLVKKWRGDNTKQSDENYQRKNENFVNKEQKSKKHPCSGERNVLDRTGERQEPK